VTSDRSRLQHSYLQTSAKRSLRSRLRLAGRVRSVGREPFMAERMRQDAVIRKLEIIGAAVKQLSNTTKEL